jgi:hypothetical protein
MCRATRNFSISFQLFNFHPDQADIVLKFLPAGKAADFSQGFG